MKVITFQHPRVSDKIHREKVYYCEYVSEFHNRTPKSYNHLTEEYRRRNSGEIVFPIFGWSRVSGETGLKLNRKNLDVMLSMVNFPGYYKVIILEVPKDFVMETDFYNFVDLRYIEEFGLDEGMEDCDVEVFDVEGAGADDVQAILGCIKEEWIVAEFDLDLLLTIL